MNAPKVHCKNRCNTSKYASHFKFPIITKDKHDQLLKFWEYQPPIMGITGQNVPQTSNSLLSPTKTMVARGNQWTSLHPSAHLHSPLCVPLCIPLYTSTHPSTQPSTYLHAPVHLCTSVHFSGHLCAPLCAPHSPLPTSLHTSVHLRTTLHASP